MNTTLNDMAPPEPAETALSLAARLLAGDDGAVERALATHRRRPDGYCTGCGPYAGRWPCFTHNAAVEAGRLRTSDS